MSTTDSVSGLQVLNKASTNGTDSATSKTKLFDDMQAFLFLLTQQLQYQDPLDPMDTSEYTNQLVQYAEVEQAIQTNSYLESMITQNINAMSAQSVSYIDKTIQALSDYVPLQDGSAKFAYTLENDASNITVSLCDSAGNYIKNFSEASKEAGRHEVVWDGKDNNGNKLPDGSYQIIAVATDPTGSSIKVTKTAFGKVTGVAYDGEDIALGMGEVAVNMNSVLAVHTNDALPSYSASATTNDIANKIDTVSTDLNSFLKQYEANNTKTPETEKVSA